MFLMIGKTLLHYEITSQLGKGGMGEREFEEADFDRGGTCQSRLIHCCPTIRVRQFKFHTAKCRGFDRTSARQPK
jgi:hypothetical protein